MSRFLQTLFRRPASSVDSQPVSRTTVGLILHWGSILVSAYCVTRLVQHNVVSYGPSMGESMYPTLPAHLSTSISSRLYRKGRNLKVGDIVSARNPYFPHQLIGKRVIGMPGDYVLRDDNLAPTAGGTPLPPIVPYDESREEPVMIQVPEGHVWLAGDNMSRSRDSRFFGPVPLALIEGKTVYNGDGWFSWTSFRGDQLLPVDEDELLPASRTGYKTGLKSNEEID